MAEQNPPKYLLHIKYGCGVSIVNHVSPNNTRVEDLIGPKDEWIVYMGDKTPKYGEAGFGRTNCFHYITWQACEGIDCDPSGGIIDQIEPYSEQRAKELGLEEVMRE
jgi:hypothetical protein